MKNFIYKKKKVVKISTEKFGTLARFPSSPILDKAILLYLLGGNRRKTIFKNIFIKLERLKDLLKIKGFNKD